MNSQINDFAQTCIEAIKRAAEQFKYSAGKLPQEAAFQTAIAIIRAEASKELSPAADEKNAFITRDDLILALKHCCNQCDELRAQQPQPTSKAEEVTDRDALIRLLNHIEEVVDDVNWELINADLWNAVTMGQPQPAEQPKILLTFTNGMQVPIVPDGAGFKIDPNWNVSMGKPAGPVAQPVAQTERGIREFGPTGVRLVLPGSREEFEKQNPVPKNLRFNGKDYSAVTLQSAEQWAESVKYHNDWLLWRQAWFAARSGGDAVDAARLREMLAYRVAGAGLYRDDGELQDWTAIPMIDFKRDSVDEIQRKLIERTSRAIAAKEK